MCHVSKCSLVIKFAIYFSNKSVLKMIVHARVTRVTLSVIDMQVL